MATVRQRTRQCAAPALYRIEQLLLSSTILVGFALRLPLLARFSFHQDEAIYGYWALHGRYVDPFFLTVWPDKPPLFLGVLSAAFALFGESAAAARLVGIAASTLTIAGAGALARHWWGARAGVIAALLLALNPYAISFAPTAFTDPLLVLCGLLALTAAARRQIFWAGVWLGAAMMTKQQGVLFLPLVAGALPWRTSAENGAPWRSLQRLGGGLLLVVFPVVWWDSLRWAVAPSPWDIGAQNAAGFVWAPVTVWWARAEEWVMLSSLLLGGFGIWLLWLAGALVWVATAAVAPERPALQVRPVLLLAGWGVAYWLLHVVTTIEVWDRYLLPLVIPVTLLAAFGVNSLLAVLSAALGAGEVSLPPARPALPRAPIVHLQSLRLLLTSFGCLLLLVLGGPALQAAQGRLPVGGDHGAYAGLDTVVDWLEARTDAAPVLYHRTLGWHFRFYLFHSVETGRLDLRWYPSDVYLADNAAKTPHRPRYLVVAAWVPERNLAMNLAARHLMPYERLRAGSFVLYEIVGRSVALTPWRVCRPSSPITGSDRLSWRRLHLGAEPRQCLPAVPDVMGWGQL